MKRRPHIRLHITGTRARIATGTAAWIFLVLVAVVPGIVYVDQANVQQAREATLASGIESFASSVALHHQTDGSWSDLDTVVSQWATQRNWSIVLKDPSGNVLAQASALAGLPEKTQSQTVLNGDGAVIGQVVIGTPASPSGNWLLVWIALLPTAAVVAAFGAVISYLLSGRILRSITDLTRVATSISRGNFSERARMVGDRESVELAESINAIALRLEEVDAQRRTIMAEVVHELRRPLTNVQGYTGIMQDQVLNFAEHLQETVGAIYRQVHLLSRQMDGLRLFAAADSGELALNRQVESVPDLLHFATEGYETRALERGVILSVDQPSNLPPVYADRDRIAQVMGNLLDNALAHMPDGGEIVVSAARNHNYVELSVTDTGEGIRDEVMPHIFDRFYSGSASHSNGFGLGLTIAKNIVDLHGGQIWATSKHGHGAKFLFTIPIYRRTMAPPPQDTRGDQNIQVAVAETKAQDTAIEQESPLDPNPLA